MIYAVQHRTSYRYGRPVDLGAHLLHLTPRELPYQRVLRVELQPQPIPGRIESGTDCYGNTVTWMFFDTPHGAFEVQLDALVEVTARTAPRAEGTPGWEAAIAAAKRPECHDVAEFRFASPMVPDLADALEYAKVSFPAGRPVLTALLDLNARIRRDFAFRPGVTGITTSVRTVLAQRAGVCQDFAHLMIAGLRGLGLPARYVSGYIRTHSAPGKERRRGADQSHAWVAAWLGPEHGWIDLDPTNDLVVSTEHVVLGWGRDYGDVSPLRGVILGGGAHSVEVGVDLEPIADHAALETSQQGS